MNLKLMDRYLAGRIFRTLGAWLLIILTLHILIDLIDDVWEKMDENSVPWSVVFTYYINLLPSIMIEMLPIAFLLTVLSVFCGMAANNELVAMLSGGVSARRVAAVPVVAGLGISIAVYIFSETVLPGANARAELIETRDIKNDDVDEAEQLTLMFPEDNACYDIAGYRPRSEIGEGIWFERHSADANRIEVIEAERLVWDESSGGWFFENGVATVFDNTDPSQRSQSAFESLRASLTDKPSEISAEMTPSEELSSRQLRNLIPKWKKRGYHIRPIWVEYHQKSAVSVTCFVIVFLAIPFAFKVRRGGIMISFGLGVVITLVYMTLFNFFGDLGKAGQFPPWAAAWAANIIFAGVGTGLFARMKT